jgi:uncharacterized membrane protein (UPF0182 family)
VNPQRGAIYPKTSTRPALHDGLENVEVEGLSKSNGNNLLPASWQMHGEQRLQNIRLMDPNVLSATYRQLQQIKPYYTFADSLDIDRYTINGQERDVVIAVRELKC